MITQLLLLLACTDSGVRPLCEDSCAVCEGGEECPEDSGQPDSEAPDTGTADTGSPDTGDSAAPQGTPKVLAVMVDGWRHDSLATSQTATLDALLPQAAYSLAGRAADVTSSGPGQTSFSTGVWRDKHGVDDNEFSDPDVGQYPHFFARLHEARPEAITAYYGTWEPFDTAVVTHADIQRFHDYADDGDALMVAALKDDLAEQDPDAVVIMLSDLDVAGHSYGFDPDAAEYQAELQDIDTQIGQMLEAIEARESFAEEDWLLVISSDHGGSGASHGGNTPDERTVPFIVAGRAAAPGEIWPAPAIVDVSPTALSHLGVALDESWDMDGVPVGLAATAPSEASFGQNLVFNGDAEYERGFGDFWPDASIPGWQDEGWHTVMVYGAEGGFPLDSDPGPPDRGANFFCGGGDTSDTSISQDVDLSALAETIDAGGVQYQLSAWLGGYASQDDRSGLSASFLDASGVALHSVTLEPFTAADRGYATGLWSRSDTGSVPAHTRSARITLTAWRSYGYNDGYADEISLVLTEP